MKFFLNLESFYDYEYMIIPPDEYYKILSKEDNLKCEVKIDSEFLHNKLSLYLSWTVRLWKAIQRIGNYHTNYDYFERQLNEGTNIDWWKIKCDNLRKRMIRFSENEILLVHKYGKFLLSSFSITVQYHIYLTNFCYRISYATWWTCYF